MISNERISDRQATAYHEAGHAVVGELLGRGASRVTIFAAGNIAGQCDFPIDTIPERFKRHFDDSREKRQYFEIRLLTKVAGSLAHDLLEPGRVQDQGDACDDQDARLIIAESAGWADEDRDGYLDQLRIKARDLLRRNWSWVRAVASALLERDTIFEKDVVELRPR